jgi:hypothetical protein
MTTGFPLIAHAEVSLRLPLVDGSSHDGATAPTGVDRLDLRMVGQRLLRSESEIAIRRWASRRGFRDARRRRSGGDRG